MHKRHQDNDGANDGAWLYGNQSAGDEGSAAITTCEAMPEETPEQYQAKIDCCNAASGC